MLATLMALCSAAAMADRLTDYVDPRIGTGDHGHVFMGANVPFGMVCAGPTQLETGWDWCSGYHDSGKKIVGFGQLHLSGTGCSDLGDIALMPVNGVVELSREGLASEFSHATETCRPGYYSVHLDRHGIDVRVSATARTALYGFRYGKGEGAGVVIDLENGVGDRVTDTRCTRIDDYTLMGFRRSRGWASRQAVYFCIRFDHKIDGSTLDNNYSHVYFNVGDGEEVKAIVGLSPTSEVLAAHNLYRETGMTFDFDKVSSSATEAWEKQLGRVKATFRTERESRIFYTAMYHFMVAPQLWDDCDKSYMGADLQPHSHATHHTLTTWSLWDTYRAAHPLATIIMPDMMRDYAQTMMAIFREWGELPMWHLMSNETYCMVGEPAVPVLADMILKDCHTGVDAEAAYQAMLQSLLPEEYGKPDLPRRGKHYLSTLGYLPYDGTEGETVAKNLEYYLAIWSAAQVAGRLGHKEDSVRLHALSMNYKKLYDPRVKCMRALDGKGEFRPLPDGFNPCHQTGDYTEGNPWQYAFLVPHDVNGLIELMGGRKAFEKQLDGLLAADSQLNEDANPDISGLIGQYAHGNEPSHHILYMYNYIGRPEKTQRLVRRVMDELYDDQPAGLCGNEDVGQMSAWYILSALGLYQVEPCGGVYQLGSPIVETATIPLPRGKSFEIRTHGGGKNKVQVKRRSLNGQPLKGNAITHSQIMAGGTLDVWF